MAEPEIELDQINIVVDDVEAAVAFYERLGFTVERTDEAWMPHHRAVSGIGRVDVDIDSVAFANVWGGIDGPCVVVNVRVLTRDDVDARYAALTGAGHTGLKPPYDAFWGARYAVVRDPGGNALGIMSPADPAHRQTGPEPPS